MSVRVNLLPREVEERATARRQRGLAAVLGVVLVAVLAVVYIMQLGRVDDAEQRLAAEEQRLQELRDELATLNEFRDLEQQQEQVNELIATAMGGEASFAGILQDVASVMPSDAALQNLNLSVNQQAEQDPFGAQPPALGSIQATGQSLRGHAPGLERFLIEFDKVAGFFDVFFNNSTVGEDGTSSFSVTIDLGRQILTQRYATGLPEGLR